MRVVESLRVLLMAVDFLFQAEDGIRDTSVTGVQTCALPISYPTHPLFLPSWMLVLQVPLLAHVHLGGINHQQQIGRASCRERV